MKKCLLASLLLFACLFAGHAQTPVTQVAAGGYHSLFLKSDGSLWGMGNNQYGQLGDGTTNNANQPEMIVSSNVTAIAAGEGFSLFLKNDGSLWAMGDNSFGQLGDGTYNQANAVNQTNLPEMIVASNVTTIAAGGYHSLFIKNDGSLWGMGDDDYGQLGDGSHEAVNQHFVYNSVHSLCPIPEEIVSSNVVAVAAGAYHSLFVKSGGDLWAMGNDNSGQIGDNFVAATYDGFVGEIVPYIELDPIVATNNPAYNVTSGYVTSIAAGGNFSLFMESDGNAWGMGDNKDGQLQYNPADYSYISAPSMLSFSFTSAAAGSDHSLFLDVYGDLWTSGANGSGQLGDGNNISTDQAQQIELGGVTAIAGGNAHSLFVENDGSLWAMGDNTYGELGDGTLNNTNRPEEILASPYHPPLTSVNGIYTGTIDSGAVAYYGGVSGVLALMVITNGQGVVALGFCTNANVPIGIYQTYAMVSDGIFATNFNYGQYGLFDFYTVQGTQLNGEIYGDDSLIPGNTEGNFTDANGGNGLFSTTLHPNNGIQQANAGFYGDTNGDFLVLAADGTACFYTSNIVQDAGYGTITSANALSAKTIPDNLTVSGMLNPTTHSISGSYHGSTVPATAFVLARLVPLPFSDTNPPALSITNAMSGMLWSNAEFTVMGTASDIEDVTNVYVSVDGAPYTNVVVTADNWVNWSASVTLSPGSNTISAFSVNQGGVSSVTKSARINYVVSAPLTLQLSGNGTISPNDSNKWLQVNANCTLTATPAAGFTFGNWTGGTSQPYSILTNKPTLIFDMQSNLVLQADFLDTLKPYLKVTNPISLVTFLTNVTTYTVTGVATDDEEVASVDYSFNHGGYVTAATMSGMQWSSASLPLMAGTNVFSAYAEATNGNYSVTDTVDIVMVSPNPLMVVTNGRGTISPANDTNGVLLDAGRNYSMTASPGSGFIFSNWMGGIIGGPMVVLTNKPTVTFMMETNLEMQADFLDTLKPYLKITNPIPPVMFVTNVTSYTVMGVATDDEEVASVDYSFNHSGYVAATTNGMQWSSASLPLTAGTNVFSVYAQATNGNYSVTDTVDIVMISPNPLMVVTNGRGTISPGNYTNGVLLDAGRNYSMTASPGGGFIFSNWMGGIIGGPMVVLTNKPTVTFMMETNLEVQAGFLDTLKPYLKVTNPISAMTFVTNVTSYTVVGVATDDEEVASVNYSFNHGGYVAATTNGIQWSSASLSLTAGTNVFSVYAQATNGNYSVTDTVDIVMISPNPLMVVTNGRGTISPANYTNGVLLDAGRSYSMTASPGSGFIFSNWMGGIIGGPMVVLTNKSTVTFMMETNLELQANFLDTLKPYLKITNPIPSLVLVTNLASYTVLGVATDDEEVASVNYTLNGAASALPISANISGWQTSLSLAEGTNTFSAWAVATNGNISATNLLTIIRQPKITTFLIATNSNITHPQAQMAFDGTNYLVVYQEGPSNNTTAIGQFVSQAGNLIGGPLSLNPGGQDNPPYLDFDGTNYLVAWADYSGATNGTSVKGVFVNPAGSVGGVTQLSQSTTVASFGTITYGGGNYLLMWTDDRALPESIYGALVSASGTNLSGDFLINSNSFIDESGGPAAAFDGTNFLAVWASDSGKMSINGQWISPTGLVGSPFMIYTNPTVSSGIAQQPCVDYNGTNFLVLFNTGMSSNTAPASNFHIQGRLVTNIGQVQLSGQQIILTSVLGQISLTADAGPQIGVGADFDSANFLASWNQGWNPFSLPTSGAINGRFLNALGSPTTAEFPIFAARPSGYTWTWAPVYYGGTNFVLVGGVGKMVTPQPNILFTNGAIYGAFVSP